MKLCIAATLFKKQGYGLENTYKIYSLRSNLNKKCEWLVIGKVYVDTSTIGHQLYPLWRLRKSRAVPNEDDDCNLPREDSSTNSVHLTLHYWQVINTKLIDIIT